jgi:hypothetical protein
VRDITRALLIVAAVCVPVAGLIAWALLPLWATPIAMWWYKAGFAQAVAGALDRLPGSAAVCVYDDQANIFVTSPSQLVVDKMIAKAVRDHTPDVSMDRRQRAPHFRAYSGGATYYWSFTESALIRFEGDRWTLRGAGRERCGDYKARPAEYRQLYRERIGVIVTEANFCCDTGESIR